MSLAISLAIFKLLAGGLIVALIVGVVVLVEWLNEKYDDLLERFLFVVALIIGVAGVYALGQAVVDIIKLYS